LPNFVFKRNFPIHKLFERSCELGLWRLTADKIASIFRTRLNRRMRGKLATVIDQIEQGHYVFRAYFKHAFLKQYEKFSTFLRNELCSNNLTDFGLRKGLDHLDEVRQTFQTITSRFAGYQAQWLNVHVDFPLLQRIALPITVGSVRYPGTKIHDVRVIRLLPVNDRQGKNLKSRAVRPIRSRGKATAIIGVECSPLGQRQRISLCLIRPAYVTIRNARDSARLAQLRPHQL
jgi:hypothetical protein